MLKIQTILIIIIFLLIIIKSILQKNKEMTDKQYFIDVLNHNLKICTLAQKHGMNLLMKEGAKTDLQKELFSSLYTSCKYNLDIISTLLNILIFENNEQNISTELCAENSLNPLYSDIVTEITKEKNIKLIYNNYLSCEIYTGKNHLKDLIYNVIYLVLMYSYKNTESAITIKQEKKNLHIYITYHGNSITNHIDTCKHDNYTAIGCSIKIYYCKKIVDFYGGKVNLTETSDNKISLSFTLPLKCHKLCLFSPKDKAHTIRNISFCK